MSQLNEPNEPEGVTRFIFRPREDGVRLRDALPNQNLPFSGALSSKNFEGVSRINRGSIRTTSGKILKGDRAGEFLRGLTPVSSDEGQRFESAEAGTDEALVDTYETTEGSGVTAPTNTSGGGSRGRLVAVLAGVALVAAVVLGAT